MRISELSRRSGVPTATIKFYLSEGLLPPGRATSATQAEYGEQHVRRLRLIRALIGVRKLSVSATRQLLDAVSEHQGDLHQILGLVLGARPVTDGEAAAEEAQSADVEQLVSTMGWQVSRRSPARRATAESLEALQALAPDITWQSLVPYAQLAEATAALDLDGLEQTDNPLERAERAILLTVLLEPVLLALRRLAQENESANRYGG